MHFAEILIDNRILCNFVDVEGADNVIFCRPLEENLNNVSTITTKDNEFIHSFITESTGDNYLVTSIQLQSGEIFTNVKFKLVVCESGELPHSTIDTSAFDLPLDIQDLKPINEVYEPVLAEEVQVENKVEHPEFVRGSFDPILVEQAKVLQNNLKQKQKELQEKEQELTRKQRIVETNQALTKTLEDYKRDLLQEYYRVQDQQKDVLRVQFDDVSKSLFKFINEKVSLQKDNLTKLVTESNQTNLSTLKEEQNNQITSLKKEISFLLTEKLNNTSIDVDRLLVERANELQEAFSDKVATELESYKQQLLVEINSVTSAIDELIKEKVQNATGSAIVTQLADIQNQTNTIIEGYQVKLTEDVNSVVDSKIKEHKEELDKTVATITDNQKTELANILNNDINKINEKVEILNNELEAEFHKLEERVINDIDNITITVEDSVDERLKNNLESTDKLLIERAAEIKDSFESKLNLELNNHRLNTAKDFVELKEQVSNDITGVTTTINNLVEEKLKNNLESTDKLFIDKTAELHTQFNEQVEQELNTYHEKLSKDLNTLKDSVNISLDDHRKVIDSNLITHKDELSSSTVTLAKETVDNELNQRLQDLQQALNELIIEHKQTLSSTFNERINEINTLINSSTQEFKQSIPEFGPKLEDLTSKVNILSDQNQEFETFSNNAKQYTDKAIARASQDAKDYARRILELGGGGGSVAQQFANGGTMNGTLNVTGQYLSGGVDLASIFGGGGSSGDPAVNSLVHSNSGNWNTAYASTTGLSTTYSKLSSQAYTLNNGLNAITTNYTGNSACSNFSVIVGGIGNKATAPVSIIAGGGYNSACGNYSIVAGGCCNTASGNYSIVAGGCQNCTNSGYNSSVVVGGNNNCTGGSNDFIGGGNNNCTSSGYGTQTVVGGYNNTIQGNASTIIGGSNNTVSNYPDHATIVGGQSNIIHNGGQWSVLLGGYCNNICGVSRASIGAGMCNGIGNSDQNSIIEQVSINQGCSNTISANYSNVNVSSIINGTCNTISANYGIVYQTNIHNGFCNCICANTNNGSSNSSYIFNSDIVNGYNNNITASGDYGNGGGISGCAFICSSGIINGCSNLICGTASAYYNNSSCQGNANSFITNSFIAAGSGNKITVCIPYPISTYTYCIDSSNISNGTNNSIVNCNSLPNATYTSQYLDIHNGSNNCICQCTNNFANYQKPACYSTILNGNKNCIINSVNSLIAGGCCNNINAFNNVYILGSNINAKCSNYTYVNNLSSQDRIVVSRPGYSCTGTAGTLGTFSKRVSAYDANGSYIGYIPIYL